MQGTMGKKRPNLLVPPYLMSSSARAPGQPAGRLSDRGRLWGESRGAFLEGWLEDWTSTPARQDARTLGRQAVLVAATKYRMWVGKTPNPT